MNITIDRKVIEQALDALESIALAGMSGSGQESEEGMREWHARQAWKFIGIAARAFSPLREALAQPQPVQQGPVARVRFSKHAFDFVDWIPYQGQPLKDGDLLYTSPQAAQPLTPEWYARWIRNNYQDHQNIATLCEELTKAAHGTTEGTT